MGFDLTKIKNFDDVWENIDELTEDDLAKLREMGVYEPVNVEDPDIDDYVTDDNLDRNIRNEPIPSGWDFKPIPSDED